jgi:hypothetical protein
MTVILEGIVGSTAYGLATPASDIDVLSTFIAPTRDILGFGLSSGQQSRVTTAPDSTSHEIGKYVSLALRCNPTILELMFLSEYEVEAGLGQELVALRGGFLSSRCVVDAYCGYAVQQAKRLLRRDEEGKDGFGDVPTSRSAKHGRHCFRLLTQAEQLLRTGTLTVRLLPSEVEKVWEAGEWAARDKQTFHDAMLRKASGIETLETSLPDNPARAQIERWLVHARLMSVVGY